MTVPRTALSQLQVFLFNNDLVTPVFQADLTDRVQGLKFSTIMPGGYAICKFTIAADQGEAWDWFTERPFYRLTITDGTKTVYEGRMEDICMDLTRGTVKPTFFGYYSNLTDVAWDTNKSQVWSDTIKDILTDNCLQISTDQSNIAATDISVNLAMSDHFLNHYPIHIFPHLMGFGDTSDNSYDFAIWEDRIPFLMTRTVSSIDWLVNIKDFKAFEICRRLRNMWNSVYGLYGTADTSTATATDSDSIEKFNLTRHHVLEGLGKQAQSVAEAARDTFLAEHKDLYSDTKSVTIGHVVTDTGGNSFPSSWVRAGDVLRVRDLVPPSGALDSVSRDKERTYFIVETEYDAVQHTNKLSFERHTIKLSSLVVDNIAIVKH